MLDRLYVKRLARPIEELGIRPPNTDVYEWSELDRRCLGYIRDYIDIGVIHHVDSITTAYGCWKKLQGLYERRNSAHKVGLIRQLGKLRYLDGEPLTEHLNQVEHIFTQLSSMGIDFSDEVQALWILGSLPESWETLSVSLSSSAPDGTLSKEQVCNSIMNEELRRDGVRTGTALSSTSETLMYEGKKFSKKKTKQPKPKAKGAGLNKKEDTCHYCNKKGHWKSECYSFKKDQAEGKVKKAENNVAIVDQQSDLIVVAGGVDVYYAAGEEDWIVDSGASFHVTPNKDFFHTYEEGNFGIAKMGNTGTSTIKAIGSVLVKTGNGKLIELKDVRHIPDFRMSLLSSGKLDDEGYHNIFGNGQWRLQKGSITVAEGIKDGTLYKAKLKVQKCEINAVEADVDVWHNRTALTA
ncbi:hypothetical protein LIER_09165 [Lithospermum erythrorhizon]|uniref:Retrovirus-related Pol polyprotein from transposon TNT 1-94-like beta-barrel domain-containing protein n=1 Tax=Lithospermum erythrorhizon TaxID=34254 RepID=A0AAV3PGC3_LITER